MLHFGQTPVFVVILAAIPVIAGSSTGAAAARSSYALQTLHSFCSKGGDKCRDGEGANGLVMDGAGNFYGTTTGGGKHTAGVAFKLTPNQDGTWAYSVIYNFCSKNGCEDGISPAGSMILDVSGNLYGIADWRGGGTGDGVVFELIYSSADQRWSEKTLYSFQDGNDDGATPLGGLAYAGASNGALYDGVSPLYGETSYGGIGGGVLFKLTPSDNQKYWNITNLHSFCVEENCLDGGFSNPSPRLDGPLAMDSQGNFYGTTNVGGQNDDGVAFELAADGTYSVLYNFCSADRCTDGSHPHANMIIDSAGNLYGTTRDEGYYQGGTLFKLSPSGGAYTFTKLYDFAQLRGSADGANPYGLLLMSSSGDLYGTASNWGKHDQFGGVAFRYSTSGQYDVLYSFCKKSKCRDGNSPLEGVVMDPSGNLFGTTSFGGAKGQGTVFRLTPD